MILSSAVSEQGSQYGKILQPLQYGSSISDIESLNRPIIPDLMGFKDQETEFSWNHVYEVGGDYLQPSLVYPEAEVFIPKPAFEYFDDFQCNSTMRVLPDSRVLFMGSEAEISNLLSMLSELYRSRKSMSLSRRQMVVPYFRRYTHLCAFKYNCWPILLFSFSLLFPILFFERYMLISKLLPDSSTNVGLHSVCF